MQRTVRANYLRRSLARLHVTERIDEAMAEQFATEGMIALDKVVPLSELQIIKGGCRRMLELWPLPHTREVADPKWHHVEKVTLVRDPQNFKHRLHKLDIHAPELLVAAKWTDTLAHQLGAVLVATGHEEAGRLLAGHKGKRSIAMRMNGTPEDPAVMGVHRDVSDETGVNLSMTLDAGFNLVTQQEVPANVMNIYACANVCEALGIEQPLHGYSADHTRLSFINTAFQS